MKLYLSGPMSGHPRYNRQSFKDAAELFRARGFEVVNPVELPEPVVPPDATEAITWSGYLVRDLIVLHEEKPDFIILLPGWRESKGACLEVHYAKEVLAIPSHGLGNFLAKQYNFDWNQFQKAKYGRYDA